MKQLKISGRPLAAALALALCAGASAGNAPAAGDGLDATAVEATAPGWSQPDAAGRERYIVVLDEAPLASYDGSSPGLASVPRHSSALSAGRPDVKSAQATAYVEHLRSVQQAFVGDVAARLGRNLPVAAQFQHAINAVALDLTPEEAAQLRERPGVKLVNREQTRQLATYNTPNLIGATQVWSGAATPGNVATKGEGIVIGVIDSGINWASNSFKATGSDGYAHVNPLGAGNYLGQCQAGKPDAGHCNDKLIGIYNLESATSSGQDLNGHGSHTASTAGGNAVTGAPFAGGTFNVSGIAPHANVVAYLACGASCADTGLTAAVNQAVADGIVDVINFSVGGTTSSPWTDTTDLAFLGAVNAGIFVAKAAGNDGPSPGSTANSAAPWETVVAATTPARMPAFLFSLTAPLGGANTVNLAAKPGATPAPTQAFNNLPLIESPNFADGSNDGCAAYPANYFRRGQVAGGAQGIAVLRLDQRTGMSNCGSGARRTAAANAGALAVVYIDPQYINLGATGASYSVLSADWNAIKATPGIDVTPTGNATASLGFPIADGPRAADNIAGFSSRGPVPFAALKPDLSAPGVDILAAKSPTVASGYNAGSLAATAQIYALDSGTSMASPHIAGSAALVRAINRSWSPLEVSSALMTTAAPVVDEDGTTPSHPNTAGAGRVDLSKATKAGLVFDESYANFLAADPTTGGKAETLNLASLYHHDCVNKCTFKRTVRSTGKAGTWTIAVTGLPAGSWTLDKTSFPLSATGTTSFSLTVDSQTLTQGQWYYGAMTLTSSDATVPVARLPIAVRAATAKLRADVATLEATAAAGATATRTVTVRNAGNPGLNWSVPTTTLAATIVERKPIKTGLFNFTIGTGSAITSTNANNAYPADYFDVLASGSRIRRLQITGFTQSTSTLSAFATQLAWRVYADNGNLPEGIPGNAIVPVFAYNSAANGAGVSFQDDAREGYKVALDVPTAGAPTPALAAGRYWFSFAPTVPSTATTNNWLWFLAEIPGKAPSAQVVNPNSSTMANRSWRATTVVSNAARTGLALKVDIDAACSAPWLHYDTTGGQLGLGGSTPVTVTFDAAGLTPGTYKAYLCVSGNGTSPSDIVHDDNDAKLIPVTFTVTAPAPTAIAASNATATPASAPIITSTILTVTVAPGANPASSDVNVEADLRSIGGSPAQQFADDGRDGDAVQGDNVYSYNATVAPGTAPGAKTLPVTVTDAQSRTASTTIALDVPAPTAMTASAAATPSMVAPGGTTRITATIAPGTLPAGSGITATADLTAIGGSATEPLYDDGTHGDVQQSDNVYSADVTVSAGTAAGVKLVTVQAADAIGRTASATAGLNVAVQGALNGSGVAAPGSALPGATVRFIVATVPGTNPASTGVTVTVDLTGIGGSATQAFYDDGTHGDSAGGDGIYGFDAVIGAATPIGAHLILPVSIADQQGRTTSTSIVFDVLSDRIFADGFE